MFHSAPHATQSWNPWGSLTNAFREAKWGVPFLVRIYSSYVHFSYFYVQFHVKPMYDLMYNLTYTFFVYMYNYVHFRSVYIHFVNKCAVSYLSEKNAGSRGQATFCRVQKNAACVREQTNVQSNQYPYVHSYVQIKTKNTFVCTKKPARIYILYGTVCTIKYTIRGYP